MYADSGRLNEKEEAPDTKEHILNIKGLLS